MRELRESDGAPMGDGLRTEITALIYELLDAHEDTAELAAGLGDITWHLHLDYLRALQRRGREILARLAREETVW